MATFSETFEGVPDGVAISTLNSNYSIVQGTLTMVGDTSLAKLGDTSLALSGTGTAVLSHNFDGSPVTTHYRRLYVYLKSTPSANTALWLFEAPSSTSVCFDVRITTSRTLQGRNSSQTSVDTTATALPLNEWSRVELSAVNGTATVRIYTGADGDNSILSYTEQMAWTYTTTSIGEVKTGAAASSTFSFNLDQDAGSDTDWIGPAAGAGEPVQIRLPIPTIQVG